MTFGDVDPPVGWEQAPRQEVTTFRTSVPPDNGDESIRANLRVVRRGGAYGDVILEESPPAGAESSEWTRVIDVLVTSDELQELVDVAAAAWTDWAYRNCSGFS